MGQNRYIAAVILVCTLGLVSVVEAQLGGGMGGGMGSIPGTAFGGATDPSALQLTDGLRIIPSITIGQRYDSNVFFVPKSLGINREDFVTTTTPQVRGLYAGDLFTVNATAGAVGEYYAKNSGLNYVGANAGVSLDMSKLASRLREGARLIVSDTYSYTPQPPAFITGDLDGQGANPLVRGLQAGRVNFQSNSWAGNGAVPISQVFSLTGNYSNGFIKFGSSEVQQVGGLFDTTFTSYGAGLAMKLSSRDTISLNFAGSEYDQGGFGSFSTRGGTLGWAHIFSPSLSMNSAAGVQLLEGEFEGGKIPATVAPTANLMLMYMDRTTSLALAYSLAVTPSYQFETQALLSHLASLTLTQQMPVQDLMGILSVNYGRSGQFGSTSGAAINFNSYGGVAGLTYKITPKTFLSLNYSYSNYDSTFGTERFAFDRQVVQLNLSQAFY